MVYKIFVNDVIWGTVIFEVSEEEFDLRMGELMEVRNVVIDDSDGNVIVYLVDYHVVGMVVDLIGRGGES